MLGIDEQLQELSERALRRGVLLFAIFAFPTAMVSILRGVNGDWLPVFTLHIVAFVLVLTISLLRHRLSHRVLGGLMLCICVVVAWAGLYTYGVAAPAGHWVLAIAIFLAGMLFYLRGMIISAVIILGGPVLIAGLHVTGVVVPAGSPGSLLLTPGTWAVELMVAVWFISIVLPTLGSFVGALRTLVLEVEEGRNKIGHLASHDELTGLPRLSIVRDRLASACHRSRPALGFPAVMFIDLDGFKQVNDSYGHDAGDECLRALSARLEGRLRGQDTGARIGGDEFVVVLETVSSREDAARLAAEVLTLLKQPLEFEGHTLEVGASIGVALYPHNGTSADSLLRAADKAMYRSKRAGRNGTAFADVDESAAGNDLPARGAKPTVVAEIVAGLPAPAAQAQLGLFDQWLDAIVSRTIVVIVTVLSLVVAANSWRIITNQAAPNIVPTVAALLLAVALFLGRRKVPLWIKMALTSSVGLLIAIPGLFLSGLAGPGIGWALAAALFLVSIFYRSRAALGIALAVILAMVLAGLGFATGRLEYGFDVARAASHPATWLVFMISATAFTGIALSVWYLHKKTFKRLMDEISAQIADLMQMATHDQVTGLPSRRLASDRLEMACVRARRADTRVAVMLVDLDGFKAVNDRLGHEAGDHCLREIAARMSAKVRAEDTVARIGGDEFLVIVDVVEDLDALSATAANLLAAIAAPIQYGAETSAVTASIGIAVFPEHGMDADALRQGADAAMYAAKASGKNGIEFAGHADE